MSLLVTKLHCTSDAFFPFSLFCAGVCGTVPRIGGGLARVGFELPQHDSAVADRQRCVVFVDGADDHPVRTDRLGDPDGVALRTQVVHKLVAVLIWV